MVDEIFHGLKHTYNIAGSLLGYAGHFDDETIEQIRRHPDVSSPPPGSHHGCNVRALKQLRHCHTQA